MDGVGGGVGAGVGIGIGVIGAPIGRGNRPRSPSPRAKATLDGDALAVEDGEERGDMDVFGFIFLGVDGRELEALEVASLSKGRRLRSRRRRWGRDGHELAGETHSVFRRSGMGDVSDVRALWRALAVTST